MIILDAHLPPSLAPWILEYFKTPCFSASYLNFDKAVDMELFQYGRAQGAVIITKDNDFLELQNRLGSPPKIIWLTCGNTSKKRLKEIFASFVKQRFQIATTLRNS